MTKYGKEYLGAGLLPLGWSGRDPRGYHDRISHSESWCCGVECPKTRKEDEPDIHMCAEKRKTAGPGLPSIERPSCKVGAWLTSRNMDFGRAPTLL